MRASELIAWANSARDFPARALPEAARWALMPGSMRRARAAAGARRCDIIDEDIIDKPPRARLAR